MKKSEVLAKLHRSRSAALNAEVRQEFNRGLLVADDYLSGKQYPDAADTSDQYFVINLAADFVDRITPMIGGGRLRTVARAVDPEYTPLAKVVRVQHEAWQEMTSLKERFLEATHDMVATGLGVMRTYIDPFDMEEIGGRLGAERIYPGQVWVDPRAQDPLDPLLGSNYIGYESLWSADDLVAMYPDADVDFKNLAITAEEALKGDTENDPLGGIIESMITDSGIKDADAENFDIDDADFNPDNYVRVIEYQWREILEYDTPDGPVHSRQWYRALVVGLGGDKSNRSGTVLSVDEIPYNMPTFVLMSSWMSRNSPYGQGLIGRIGDMQDLLNVLISMGAKQSMNNARFGQVFVGYASSFEPETIDALMSGDVPNFIPIKGDSRHDNMPPSNHIDQVMAKSVDYGPLAGMIQTVVSMMEGASGVDAVTRGSVNPEKRTSGIALKQMQSVALLARDTQRAHANAAASALGRLGLAMIQYHWSGPMSISDVADGPNLYVNQRLPMSRENSMRVDNMLMNPQTPEGHPMIPNGLRAVGGDGEEVVLPLDIDTAEWAREQQAMGQFSEVDYVINDISALDMHIKVEVEADYDTRLEEKRQVLGMMLQMKPDSVSWETFFEAYVEKYPEMSVEKERERLYTDSFMKQMAELITTHPEAKEQLQGFVQQLLQGAQRGAMAGPPQQGMVPAGQQAG